MTSSRITATGHRRCPVLVMRHRSHLTPPTGPPVHKWQPALTPGSG